MLIPIEPVVGSSQLGGSIQDRMTNLNGMNLVEPIMQLERVGCAPAPEPDSQYAFRILDHQQAQMRQRFLVCLKHWLRSRDSDTVHINRAVLDMVFHDGHRCQRAFIVKYHPASGRGERLQPL